MGATNTEEETSPVDVLCIWFDFGKHCPPDSPSWADDEHPPEFSTVLKLDQRRGVWKCSRQSSACTDLPSAGTKARDRLRAAHQHKYL